METRMKKYNQLSPQRAKVWTEKSPKYQQTRKVPVIYYLCRNRQLEHPHFMEVPLSSPERLYLRDVINRLNVLRGRGMATLYSWSCKRGYKNGFVWHDLCEDDVILPAHGNEYVLKGSELFEESNSSKVPTDPFSSIGNVNIQPLKQLPDPASSHSQDDSSSSSSMNGKETKSSQEDDLSLSVLRPDSSSISLDSGGGKSSWGGCFSLTEYKVYKTDGLSDASTQTEENVSTPKTRETCTRGVSTDDGTLELERSQTVNNEASNRKQNYDAPQDSVSPPPLSSSASSSAGRTETLESLIRADASKMNSFRIVEEEEIRMPTNARLKATNVLMQLISCGSISVKDHSFGLIPSYKPSFSHSKFPSPLFSTTVMLGELNRLSENPRMMGLRLEDKEYFSGSLIETKMLQGDGVTTLKRSSSYNADRTFKQLNSAEDRNESSSGHSKCIPRAIKASLSKQPRGEPMKSPTSDRPRTSSDGVDSSKSISPSPSNDSSKRCTESCSSRRQSKRLDSFREDEEDVVKIEERLASGARVIIWSKSTL
ncbi:protein UPSTREAM OF FLC-like isoform X2 [Cucurbita pepo subsp. pepo]|uniref:protein UPSTREAM OF FLC-like isoform X1 n=2 Tax=Cucurbita pepo subsp. pepo TaxID=3664 RepID=UPI000C9DA00C|nr:protein UPSTREAM OF FLC-like isoform X1 [Cucurbita pepo subsp. pepo]XP_023533613.1 protein UPSTREAM OF FLC-like isoform X1 [Cucurbita pepo subsp. pepo]XP_023533614.1 protein UPSTREAM OF FLC-like isoform X1 [Cucurbita pepo subsp. pepo]XP_023533615.1 protein UPSTREAM OF FLC-like isoform X1 [Cucurbita pepo subsp. pepo]XP_023533616.1 protein UPSTREAM OF FLC-like isoform X2 [Cucurbita pepo subsp. pepo]